MPQMKKEKEYDRACFESIHGNNDEAIRLLESAIYKKQTTVEWIQLDQDLDFIRGDTRYKLLISKAMSGALSNRYT
jgi:hypothetical protein